MKKTKGWTYKEDTRVKVREDNSWERKHQEELISNRDI